MSKPRPFYLITYQSEGGYDGPQENVCLTCHEDFDGSDLNYCPRCGVQFEDYFMRDWARRKRNLYPDRNGREYRKRQKVWHVERLVQAHNDDARFAGSWYKPATPKTDDEGHPYLIWKQWWSQPQGRARRVLALMNKSRAEGVEARCYLRDPDYLPTPEERPLILDTSRVLTADERNPAPEFPGLSGTCPTWKPELPADVARELGVAK